MKGHCPSCPLGTWALCINCANGQSFFPTIAKGSINDARPIEATSWVSS